ncbi:nidogen [Phlebotomus argentipes]|uniref:nidogen n=1 Tax=Phlebotomus argentipes TaxID=94469 RepID=UPI0028934D9E|nr:nidogen [Phlebotomus argentipes]
MRSLVLLLGLFLGHVLIPSALAVSLYELYDVTNGNQASFLPPGNDKFASVRLGTPVHFFTQQYDEIFVNTNGLLTFRSEYPFFANAPFPIEYPAIAPFYSNVDTSVANETTQIAYYVTHDPQVLYRATDVIRNGFTNTIDFEARSLFVATWQSVGHFDQKADALNTYQVALICGDRETYVEFLYPEGGLNWIKGDVGESGLPDVRAQAGFVSEEGEVFTLKGSGQENVKYLSELTNYGVPGVFLYRVGPLGYDQKVQEPDRYLGGQEAALYTCRDRGKHRCHSNANCEDTRTGFCCACKAGYYGNGYNCIQSDAPIRVSGLITGTVGDKTVNSQLQSYVVTSDGRTYTAISPLEPEVGSKLQVLQVIGSGIAWLFAKPVGNVQNGYQLTGGTLNHTAVLRFEGSGEECRVVQRFTGLNVWDQLAVAIELDCNLPEIPYGARLRFGDYVEEFTRVSDTELRSNDWQRRIFVQDYDKDLVFSLSQVITFEKCPYAEKSAGSGEESLPQKITKVSASYEPREQAIRISMLSKAGIDRSSNPCTDGSAICGENSLCVPSQDEDDAESYVCQCKNGFAPDRIVSGVEHCVDIDECRGVNICDANAECYNELGGYSCICRPGYQGNGYECTPEGSPQPAYPSVSVLPEYPTPPQKSARCESQSDCSNHAICISDLCFCLNGFSGDGKTCQQNCADDEEWVVNQCVHRDSLDQDYQPVHFCTEEQCTCPHGFQILEFAFGTTCVHQDDNYSYNGSEYYNPEGNNGRLEQPSCNEQNNCSPYADCLRSRSDASYECVCKPGYDGDGHTCEEKSISCADEDICDVHATCKYLPEERTSICVCDPGYEGNGRTCFMAAECMHEDDCGIYSVCESGMCHCKEGFERDMSDFCVPIGSCGGAICAENALCRWDHAQMVSYCFCPPEFEGDGIHTCKSKPPACNVRNNCGLYASCVPNYRDSTVYECVCDPGFEGDGFVCRRELNCVIDPRMCHPQATCVASGSGVKCICNQGYIGNGTFCAEVQQHETGFLLISQGVAVVRVPFSATRGRPVSMSQMAIGVDNDCTEGRVYWSDISSKNIMSSKYDGSDKKVFISEDILSPEGIAVDWISRRIYWTDSTKDTIEVASLDDPKLRAVIIRKDLVNPRGIAVDPHHGKIYWSDWNRAQPKIEWANLDGTAREILLTQPQVMLPNSLAIFQKSGELCYADAGNMQLGCIDTYSKSHRVVVSNLSYPFGLAISDDHFYWTDWSTKRIESIDLMGNRKMGISGPLFGSHKMYGMTAVTAECPMYFSECQVNNGDCPESRICLHNPNAPSGRSCKCANSQNCNELPFDD